MRKKGFSKGEVYNNMLKLAGELWNLSDAKLNSIDPVMKLLFRGLSDQVEKIGDELQSTETRILKRIARQLMPTELVTVSPAHGIIHLTPTERSEISRYDHFSFDKRWINKEKFNREESRQINFTPAGSFKTTANSLVYRLEKNRVASVDGLSMEVLDVESYLDDGFQIILGFNHLNTDSITLYFDWLSGARRRELFSALGKVRASTLGGKNLDVRPGLNALDESDKDFQSRLDPTIRLEQEVRGFYSNHFLELDLRKIQENELFPDTNLPHSVADTLNDLDDGKEKVWISLQFPKEFRERDLRELYIQINCVPVVNREMKREIFRLQPDLNIRRLDFDGSFMNVERVVTTDDVAYTEDSSIKLDNYEAGTYSIRNGGIGRLDERDAAEFLSYLMNLITEEKQAFASMAITATGEDLRTIEQAVKRVQKRIQNTGEKGLSPYLLLKPKKDYENVYIYYWVCSGELANGIGQSSILTCKTPGLTRDGVATLVTTTLGGRDDLSDTELIETYRHALLSKDTIVTREDIISLCKVVGGEHIAKVEIDREISPSPIYKEGLISVLSIKLFFKESGRESLLKDYILQRIQAELSTRSNFSMPYKISAING